MSKTDILNKIFNNKILSPLIPVINPILTLLKNKRIVFTLWDKRNKRWILKESSAVIYIDTLPLWNVTYKKLEQTLLDICCKHYLPKQGDIVIDLGAGVGTETLIFQKLAKDNGKVFSIEAHPSTYSSLRLLSELNNYKNVSLHQIGIGQESGFVRIEDKGLHVANAITNVSDPTGIQIEMQSLDDFVSNNKIEKIDFLKVNIEGAEEYMIEGMKNSIKIINNIAISCHDFLEENPNDRIRNKLLKYLDDNDFETNISNDPHPVRRSWIYASRKVLS